MGLGSDVDGVRRISMSPYRLAPQHPITVMRPGFDPMSSVRDEAGAPS
jgi:hypothetical protein